MLTLSQIQEIELLADSPFYLCDGRRFCDNYDLITAGFSAHWPNFILAYSYKTNYIPFLCEIIRDKGGWAEVVSRLEYDLAVKLGQDLSKIIFNGPVKSHDDIELALNNESIINLDSLYELDHILQYARQNPDKEIPIGLRVNMGLSDSAGVSHIQNQLPVGRFGFSGMDDCMMRLCADLQEIPNLAIVSLHGHTSTSDRSLWCFESITRTLCSIAEKFFPQTIRYINIGGGFFGDVPECMGFSSVPSVDQYARTICGVLKENAWAMQSKPALVVEPGIAMSANVMSLVTKVIGVKTINAKTLVTVDGSVFYVKPTMHSRNQPWSLIRRNEKQISQTVFSVVGSTCMEKDYLLMDVEGPLPAAGDYIQIGQAGAYTVVMSPPFINPAPAIVAPHGGQFRLIRTRQTLDDMFKNYMF